MSKFGVRIDLGLVRVRSEDVVCCYSRCNPLRSRVTISNRTHVPPLAAHRLRGHVTLHAGEEC